MGSEDDDVGQKFDRTIMIASIFFLLAVAMLMCFLHLYIKYVNRRRESRRRASLHRLFSRQIIPHVLDLNLGSETPKTGLESTVLDSLPAFKFKVDPQVEDGEITECSICLGTIVEDAMVRVLPNCKHIFHNGCIDAWFKSNVTCPVCRTVAEPMVQPQEEKKAQPSAPPLDQSSSRNADRSGFRICSFRCIGRERSSTSQSCENDIIDDHDIERQ